MQSTNRVVLGVLLALCFSGIAAANSPEVPPTTPDEVSEADLRSVTHMQLDGALEAFASVESGPPIQKLSGPSQMDCEEADVKPEDVETCTVTNDAPSKQTAPAALVQN